MMDAADGTGDVGGASGSVNIKVRVSNAIKNALQTIFQNGGSTETKVLDHLDMSGSNWNSSNASVVVAALLHHAGLQYSGDGKRVWRSSNPEEVLSLSAAAGRASLRPASRNATARDEVQAAGMEAQSAPSVPRPTRAPTHGCTSLLPEW